MWTLFIDALQNSMHFDPDQLTMLARMGVRFVRFPASGYWSADWLKFERNVATHWEPLDKIFEAAERTGLRLVPSLFFNAAAVPYHCNEPIQAWLQPESRTRQLAGHYAKSFSTRYGKSTSLLMYEFTNELNDWVDFPRALEYWPGRDEALPGRQNTAADRLSSDQLRDLGEWFAQLTNPLGTKLVGLGSNIPRPNAWHLARGNAALDDRNQAISQLASLTPRNMRVVGIHLYQNKVGAGAGPFDSIQSAINVLVAATRLRQGVSFLGEFGVPRSGNVLGDKNTLASMIEAALQCRVDYAALWNYSPRRFQEQWDVGADADRFYQLQMIEEANQS